MITRANTWVTIYRGETTNEWDDEVDDDVIVARHVPASILEQTTKAFTEVTQLPRSFRFAKMRLTPGFDIRQNDRVYDESTEEWWTIVQISKRGNPVRKQDLRIDLEMMG